ncbi:MAG TPA: Sir2 family NAD-dependent protein deacetylase [Phycisphaerae bacterium]|nr:Sir2 family NAD-dependent protein deacetylase [Phycisphaerae bacterium]HRY70160.1 Sir2 family NAD-dependent protein deacetylase [Phycisphaerae bacterium]HSA29681.1 Sir2 family NAD-dependent protein deacetylase [Phycisphaerae bacterium]
MGRDDVLMDRAAELLRHAGKVVVFTGAGISAESGIPTFRDSDGLWSHFPPDQFATMGGLLATAAGSPRRVGEFIIALLEPVAKAAPNAGHKAIAALQTHTHVTVVTQNVDRLHQEAGSTRVHEVHGSLFDIVYRRGGTVSVLTRPQMLDIVATLKKAMIGSFPRTAMLAAIRPFFGIGRCGLYRPSIVLFGEAMAEPDWPNAVAASHDCDCMIAVGTSGSVFPAASLPLEASANGATVIVIDPGPARGDIGLRGTAGTVLPELVHRAFS